MPLVKFDPDFTIVAGGLTKSIPVTDQNEIYRVSGTATITVDNVFQESGTATEGMVFIYDYRAVATYSGGQVKFHGTALSAQQALKRQIVTAEYTGGAWIVNIDSNMSQNDVIESDKILSLVYTKLTGTTRGNFIVGDAAGLPSLLALTADGQILIGNGTDPVSQSISGVITLSKTGVTAFVAGQILNAAIAAGALIDFSKLAALTSGNLLLGSAGNVPTSTAMSGDITITNAGVTAIGSQKVLVAMLLATLRDNIIGAHNVKFTTGNLFADGQLNEFTCPYNCDIIFGFAEVTTLIEATNAATAILTIGGVAVTNGTITLTAGAVVGSQFTCTPTAAMSVTAGQKVGIHTAKVTSGGAADVWITVRRT